MLVRPSTYASAVALALLALAGNGATRADSSPASLCDQIAARAENPRTFVSSLRRGEVGCLHQGAYRSDNRDIEFERPNVTLTSVPGERATVVGRIWISRGADGVVVRNLALNGRNPGDRASPMVNADQVVFRQNKVTNRHTAICFLLGHHEYGAADGTLIEGNRIHDCGRLPATNHDHGIYVAEAHGTVIRDNWIYDNADRGVQLYPNADGSLVTGNVIDGNGQGVLFAGDSEHDSADNLVERNVITNSTIRYNIESHWQGATGSGNVARDNCVWGGARAEGDTGGIEPEPDGFTAVDNLIADPLYVDRHAGDFRLEDGSPCGAL